MSQWSPTCPWWPRRGRLLQLTPYYRSQAWLGLVGNPANAAVAPIPQLPASTCGTSTDSSGALNLFFSLQPANTTITAPAGSCWNVDNTVTIQGRTGLTFNGNGSVFYQKNAPTDTNFSPLLQLWLEIPIPRSTTWPWWAGTTGRTATRATTESCSRSRQRRQLHRGLVRQHPGRLRLRQPSLRRGRNL